MEPEAEERDDFVKVYFESSYLSCQKELMYYLYSRLNVCVFLYPLKYKDNG